MIVFYGTRAYGKVDHVPGLFYVVTNFFYIQFVPFVPVGSFLMIDDGSERGVKIGLSLKSVLMGWIRAGLLIGVPVAFVLGIVELGEQKRQNDLTTAGCFILAGLLMLLLYIGSYKFTKAGRERAVRLAQCADLDPAFVHDYFDRLEGLVFDDDANDRRADDRNETAEPELQDDRERDRWSR